MLASSLSESPGTPPSRGGDARGPEGEGSRSLGCGPHGAEVGRVFSVSAAPSRISGPSSSGAGLNELTRG